MKKFLYGYFTKKEIIQWTIKHMIKYTTSLLIVEIQIKTISSYLLLHTHQTA